MLLRLNRIPKFNIKSYKMFKEIILDRITQLQGLAILEKHEEFLIPINFKKINNLNLNLIFHLI